MNYDHEAIHEAYKSTPLEVIDGVAIFIKNSVLKGAACHAMALWGLLLCQLLVLGLGGVQLLEPFWGGAL